MNKIMFNDQYRLTDAVLSRGKTQTRRIIPKSFFSLMWDEREDTLVFENDFGDGIDIRHSAFAKYKVGEVVAVAQSYNTIYHELGLETMDMLLVNIKNSVGWTNKMFVCANLMSHRIRITDVRVERLQDISDEDCVKEGIRDYSTPTERRYGYSDFVIEEIVAFRSPREAYAALIDKISGKGTWESNPYVFVYDFELIK